MQAMNFQDVVPSVPSGTFKNHFVQVFDLSSLQDATKKCHRRELNGELLRLKVDLNFCLEHVTEISVLCNRMLLVAVDFFGVLGKKNSSRFSVLQHIFNPVVSLKYQYLQSILLIMF